MINEPTEEVPQIPFRELTPIGENNALKNFFGENFEKSISSS